MAFVDKANQAAEKGEALRLRRALLACEQQLKVFRDQRLHAITQFVGAHYGRTAVQQLPMNVLAGAVLALVPNLVSGTPKAWCRPKTLAARPLADRLGLDLDKWIEETGFADRLRMVVQDGLFGPAFFWTGIAPGDKVDLGDILLDYGTVVTDRVSLDDYRIDPQARTREAALFEGHVTEMPYEYVMESATYRNKDGLSPFRGLEGDKRAEDLSRGDAGPRDGVVDIVRLVELWLPRGFDGRDKPLLVTMPLPGNGDLPLRVEDYEGPERGPYDDLAYYRVPDNAVALPPVAVFLDLHEAINRFVRKMFRQMDREKVLGIIEDVAAQDGAIIRQAEDGDLILVKDKERIGQLQLGGARTDKSQVLSGLLQFFSKQAGNMDLIAGLENVAPTLGQEQMLAGNSSVRIEDMRRQVQATVRSVFKKVAWYLYTDPLHEPSLLRRLPGTDIEIETTFTPEERAEADIQDFDIDIQPHSWRPDTPERAAEKMLRWVAEVAIPLAPTAAAQGANLNAEEIIRRVAQLQGIDEVDELFSGAEQAAVMGMGSAIPWPGGTRNAGAPSPAQPRITISRPAAARPPGGRPASDGSQAPQPRASPAAQRG
jgi:hypothetical protein